MCVIQTIDDKLSHRLTQTKKNQCVKSVARKGTEIMQNKYLYSDITDKIIRCFYNVFDELGAGFLESIYVKALIIELKNIGLNIESEKEIKVNYKGTIIGNSRADIVVEDKVIIEIKAISALNSQHEAQLLNYLKATGIRIGLLVNFGNKLEFKRRIY